MRNLKRIIGTAVCCGLFWWIQQGMLQMFYYLENVPLRYRYCLARKRPGRQGAGG